MPCDANIVTTHGVKVAMRVRVQYADKYKQYTLARKRRLIHSNHKMNGQLGYGKLPKVRVDLIYSFLKGVCTIFTVEVMKVQVPCSSSSWIDDGDDLIYHLRFEINCVANLLYPIGTLRWLAFHQYC